MKKKILISAVIMCILICAFLINEYKAMVEKLTNGDYIAYEKYKEYYIRSVNFDLSGFRLDDSDKVDDQSLCYNEDVIRRKWIVDGMFFDRVCNTLVICEELEKSLCKNNSQKIDMCVQKMCENNNHLLELLGKPVGIRHFIEAIEKEELLFQRWVLKSLEDYNTIESVILKVLPNSMFLEALKRNSLSLIQKDRLSKCLLHRNLILIGIALKRWKLINGDYPDSLFEISKEPTLIDILPLLRIRYTRKSSVFELEIQTNTKRYQFDEKEGFHRLDSSHSKNILPKNRIPLPSRKIADVWGVPGE